MSTDTRADGVQVVAKEGNDRRFSKGLVGARTEPRFTLGDVSLWKFAPDGQRYTLYMSTQDLYDIADAISALLDYLDDEDEDEG